MKLLFDQNLSPKLPARLADLHPDSDHVINLGLDQATDEEVWDYAEANGFTIVTKDSDYPNLVALRGHPPKVIWLRLGNCTTQQVADAIRAEDAAVQTFDADPSSGVLEIQ
jgi:predicted nuclease of predicted toxin-antitoxin system